MSNLRWMTIVLLALLASSCTESETSPSGPTNLRFDTTRLCALVPARDPSAAIFPPTPPVRVFGTDLGWTYAQNGTVTMLFGDSWQRIDICPLQLNDDSLATLEIPADDWPGFTTYAPLPDAECPELTFAVDAAGTAFAPIELRRWDSVVVPLGPLNTPVAGFFDGQREWGVFIVGGGQACSPGNDQCPTDFSAQAADLACGAVGSQTLCVDPTSTRRGAGAQAYYLHFAERVGATSYISRAMFLTNKYLNLTTRTVRAFDADNPGRNDYGTGAGALLVWGRPGFDDASGDGESPPYFMYLPLPLDSSGDRIIFAPRYLSGISDGLPTFSSSQADAMPLYTGESAPVNHAAVSYVEPLRKWLMIYGGSSADFGSGDIAGYGQPEPGAMSVRFAAKPWGPWSDAAAVLTNENMAQDIVCGKQAPVGCLPTPDPPIRPACLEAVDPGGGGNLYGANIIDVMTRASASSDGGQAADIFWNVSTWHPYSVVLVRTHIEAE